MEKTKGIAIINFKIHKRDTEKFKNKVLVKNLNVDQWKKTEDSNISICDLYLPSDS